jgi:hypothetical protein
MTIMSFGSLGSFFQLKYTNNSILLQRIKFYSNITILYIINDQFFWCLAI